MVGDRYLTDILFGNLHGMFTIHTSILSSANENVAVRMVRYSAMALDCKLTAMIQARLWESKLVAATRKRSVPPPPHKFQQFAGSFLR